MTTNERKRFQEGGHLFLQEEVLLLALSNEKGTVAGSSMLSYTLAGALLGELLIRGHVVASGKHKHAEVVNREALGEPLLDECLERIVHAKKPDSLETWVARFASIKKLKHRVAQGLCAQRILKASEDTVLLVFRRTLYPQVNPIPEKQIVERLRKAIFRSTRHLDAHTAALVSLAHTSGLLKQVFDAGDLKDRKERIQAIIDGEVVGEAARGAVQAAQTAAVVAMIAASTAATAARSSSR